MFGYSSFNLRASYYIFPSGSVLDYVQWGYCFVVRGISANHNSWETIAKHQSGREMGPYRCWMGFQRAAPWEHKCKLLCFICACHMKFYAIVTNLNSLKSNGSWLFPLSLLLVRIRSWDKYWASVEARPSWGTSLQWWTLSLVIHHH